MNEQIKVFSLVVITVCVFIMTVIDILNVLEEKKERSSIAAQTASHQAEVHEKKTDPVQELLANQPKTTIEFEETSFDFGEMNEGDKEKHKFIFTNTGAKPLIIADAKGSCGCTVPSYPKEPILPGNKAEIEVEFNSSGKEGLVEKSVTVFANTEPQENKLEISAMVNKPK